MRLIRRNKPGHDLGEKPAHSIVWQINSVKRFAELFEIEYSFSNKMVFTSQDNFYFIQKCRKAKKKI